MMARKPLAQHTGQRVKFKATIHDYGWRDDYSVRTACLNDISIGSRIVAGHAWIDWTWTEPRLGSTIEFTARVQEYHKKKFKGIKGGKPRYSFEADYTLVDIGDVQIVSGVR